jgi:hypothetical protein
MEADALCGRHLSGEVDAGLYPLQLVDFCRLLARDFDGSGWALDALAFLDVTHDAGIPVALERSRLVWQPDRASTTRQMP